MSDATLDRILMQCKAFIKDPDSNYMLEVLPGSWKITESFPRKIRKTSGCS